MKGLLEALIPPEDCLHCGLAGPEHLWLCEGCRGSLAPFEGEQQLEGGLKVRAAFHYGGAAQSLIPKAKEPVEPPLYRWLLEQSDQLPQDGLLVPVPSHWRRRIERGGCHTTVLARALSERCGLPLRQLLSRSKHGPRQSSLQGEARRKLNEDSFAATGAVDAAGAGKIILVDDVMTTGSTLRAAARALLAAQEPSALEAWVLAIRV